MEGNEKMVEITTIFNRKLKFDGCLGCHLVETDAFADGLIAQTDKMQLSLDLELAYPGMMILSPKRHVEYFDQLNAGELADWNKLLFAATKALRQDSSCLRIVYSFRSFAGYHIHLAIVPVWADGSYKSDYTILSDLVKDAALLREKNIEDVVSYKELLQERINQLCEFKK